ncbi:MAG: aminoglycoside phosphotransferase family protein [Pseudomonadota bacterium]
MNFLTDNGVQSLKPYPNLDESIFEFQKEKTSAVGHRTKEVHAISNKGTSMVELARVSSLVVSALRSYTIDRGEHLINYLPQIDAKIRLRACLALIESSGMDEELRHHVVEALSALLEFDGAQTVVHGDLAPRNMLLEEKSQSIIVFDFSDIGFATVEYELGKLVSTISERENGTALCRELLGCIESNGAIFDHEMVVANAHLHKAYLSVLLENEPLDVKTLAAIARLSNS